MERIEGIMTGNGHCTYLPGNRWILNDTYPDRSGSSISTTSPPANAFRWQISTPGRNT